MTAPVVEHHVGLGRPAESVELHCRATCADAIAELRGEPVADEDLQRLTRSRDIADPRGELFDFEQARVAVRSAVSTERWALIAVGGRLDVSSAVGEGIRLSARLPTSVLGTLRC